MLRQSLEPRRSGDHVRPATSDQDWFRDRILDHASCPRHFGALAAATCSGEAVNPICGDRYRVTLQRTARRIEAIGFTGTGCSISMASASMMAEIMQQADDDAARSVFERFYDCFRLETSGPLDESLGDLIALSVVRHNPTRIKCATLPWEALIKALQS